jgi:hypothetical protein
MLNFTIKLISDAGYQARLHDSNTSIASALVAVVTCVTQALTGQWLDAVAVFRGIFTGMVNLPLQMAP